MSANAQAVAGDDVGVANPAVSFEHQPVDPQPRESDAAARSYGVAQGVPMAVLSRGIAGIAGTFLVSCDQFMQDDAMLAQKADILAQRSARLRPLRQVTADPHQGPGSAL